MENYGYLLSDCSRLLRRNFDETVKSLGLTGPQARLLLMLERQEGENQSFYADMLDVEAITLCRMVDRMEEGGLISRRPAPEDRRARILVLTDRAREILQDVRDRVYRMLDEVSEVLEPAEIAALQSTLTKLCGHLKERRAQGAMAHG